MVEKKFVIDGMKLSYTGPFDIIEFYKKVNEWISKKGKEKEIKKKAEHVNPTGKDIEWSLEIWEDVTDYARNIVRINALFNNVKEIKIKREKKERKLNKGSVLITFDGIMETDIQGKWTQKPIFFFLKTIVDKFIWKHHMNKIEDQLDADVHELYDVLTDFFNSYKL